MNWSEEEYQEYVRNKNINYPRAKPTAIPKKKSKYKNKITHIDGLTFRSTKEGQYYSKVKLLKENGTIAGYVLQPQFVLCEGNDIEKAITYKADFIIFNLDGTFEIVDVKGMETAQWKRTFKQFRLKYPNLKLTEIK